MSKLALENARFQPSIHFHEGGSIFLGYLTTDLVVPMGDTEEPLVVSLRDLRVRIGAGQQDPVVTFPSREYRDNEGKVRRSAHYWVSGATKERVIVEVFNLPAVKRAYEKAFAMLDAQEKPEDA
ncbi:MAG: hypothetical protein MI923_08200 [Phycisphaerales bacterium]|nr:hypothetical protein [Phycisphaerales bacterium]